MANCKTCGHLILDPNKAYGWGGPICQCSFGQTTNYEDKETIDEMDIPPPELSDSE